MTFPEFLDRLGDLRAGRLPGPPAQLRLAPVPRPGWAPGVLSASARRGAALAAVFERGGVPHVLLTVRAERLAAHAGQVSLPGGRVEAGESDTVAALREAHEEVGLDPEAVELVGGLTPLFIPASRYNLYPFVGVVRDVPTWRPDAGEVDRVLEVPLESLRDPRRSGWYRVERSSGSVAVPYFAVEDTRVWGATAMVLAELLAVTGTPPDPGEPPAAPRGES